MDNKLITYFKHIIQLETTIMIQKDTLEKLQHEISLLGHRNSFQKPVKQQAVMPSVQYQVQNENYDTAYPGGYATIFGCISGLIGILYGLADGSNIIFGVLGAGLFGFIGLLIGLGIGAIIGAIVGAAKSAEASSNNELAQMHAEEEAQRLYEKAQKDVEIQYRKDLEKYKQDLANDAYRVSIELKQKDALSTIYQQLEIKHHETEQVLESFYHKGNIYSTYRNIIAICHITEYLESGICTELTGPNGAYMVYKHEMYEERKIKQLDTIITQLNQIHFDNQMLNASLQQIENSVSNLTGVVTEIKKYRRTQLQKMNKCSMK